MLVVRISVCAYTICEHFLYISEQMFKLDRPNDVVPAPRRPYTNCNGYLLHGSGAKSQLLKSSGYVIQTRN